MLSLFSFALFGSTRRCCREILQRRAGKVTAVATRYYKQIPSMFVLQMKCCYHRIFFHPLSFAKAHLSFCICIYSLMSISSGYMSRLPGINQLRRWEFVVGATADWRRGRYRFLCHRRIEGIAEAHGCFISAAATARWYNRFGSRRHQDVGKDGGRSRCCCRRGQPTWHELECVFEYHDHAIGYSSGMYQLLQWSQYNILYDEISF